MVETICENCGKGIFKYSCFFRMNKHHFCNNKCHYEWRHENKIGYNKGIKRTELQKKQISETIKRKIREGAYSLRNLEIFKKRNTPWNKGKICLSQRGEKHFRWKGGIGNYYLKDDSWQLIRRQILKRDNFICQVCGVIGVPLDVHHRIPFRIFNSHSLGNLISICRSCHCKLDSRIINIERMRKND